MSQSNDYLEISFRSIRCFSDDGRLNVQELDDLLGVALRDGRVDDEERRVLSRIVSLLKPEELTPDMQTRLGELRAMYGIG